MVHGKASIERNIKMGASSIFEIGNETINTINVKSSSSLPCSLLVFSPTTKGSYPVLLFFHGFMLQPSWYKSLLQHISSHRYIIVAPQVPLTTTSSYILLTYRKNYLHKHYSYHIVSLINNFISDFKSNTPRYMYVCYKIHFEIQIHRKRGERESGRVRVS